MVLQIVKEIEVAANDQGLCKIFLCIYSVETAVVEFYSSRTAYQ